MTYDLDNGNPLRTVKEYSNYIKHSRIHGRSTDLDEFIKLTNPFVADLIATESIEDVIIKVINQIIDWLKKLPDLISKYFNNLFNVNKIKIKQTKPIINEQIKKHGADELPNLIISNMLPYEKVIQMNESCGYFAAILLTTDVSMVTALMTSIFNIDHLNKTVNVSTKLGMDYNDLLKYFKPLLDKELYLNSVTQHHANVLGFKMIERTPHWLKVPLVELLTHTHFFEDATNNKSLNDLGYTYTNIKELLDSLEKNNDKNLSELNGFLKSLQQASRTCREFGELIIHKKDPSDIDMEVRKTYALLAEPVLESVENIMYLIKRICFIHSNLINMITGTISLIQQELK